MLLVQEELKQKDYYSHSRHQHSKWCHIYLRITQEYRRTINSKSQISSLIEDIRISIAITMSIVFNVDNPFSVT